MEKKDSSYRWVVFGSVLFTYFLIVSQRTAPGLITDQLMKDFNVTASAIGLMTSVQFFAYAGLQIPIGLLSDRLGPNRFLITGALLNGLGTIIYSLSPNEYVLFISRFLVGMGDATIWINLVLILSGWFRVSEFVGLLGFAGMSGSLGSLLATVPFSLFISAAGWRTPFFATGVLLCLASFLLYFVLIVKPKRIFKLEAKKTTSLKREKTSVILQKMFRNRQAWATFFCHFGIVGTYIGFIGSWAVPYGMHVYGLSRSGASQLIMYGLFGAIIGAPLTSWLAGRLKSIKKHYIFIHFIVFLCWVTLFFTGAKPLYVVVVLLFFITGYGTGASSLTFAVIRKSFPMTEVGVVSGFANSGGFLSAILLPSIFGKVLEQFHQAPLNVGYQYGFIISIIFSLMGLIGGIFIKENNEEEINAAENVG